MKKTLTTGLMMVLSAAVLSACGTDGALNAAALGGSDNAFSQLSLENSDAASALNGFRNKKPGQMGAHKGPQGAGFALGLGSLTELNLTDAQKAEIQALMEAAKANQPARPNAPKRPAAPDAAAIKAVQDKISAAFISDNFDADALHAEMESLHPTPANERPDPAVMELAHAQQTLDLWNVLTAEQKATVTTQSAAFASKIAEMKAHRPDAAGKGAAQMFNPLTSKLGLSTEQQAALTAAFEANRPVAAPAKPDPQSLVTLLNSGSATAASIAALHTRPEKIDHNPLTALATLHSILTADQRQTFVDSGLLKQPRPGGPGGHPMMGQHPRMGERPGMGERPNIQFDA